jgi:chemotaxis protein MotB
MRKTIVRKRHDEDEVGNWAVSLSDLVMNLLCFFVLLLAVSQIDAMRYKDVAQSLGDALGRKEAADTKAAPLRLAVDQRQRDLQTIQARLAQRIGPIRDQAELALRPDAVALSLKSGILFDLGRADLRPGDYALLDAIAAPLLDIPCRIVVEGHTDNLPIQSAQFPSNWELSAARASAVARYLIGKGFAKDRLQIVGCADTRPVAPNETAKGEPIPDNQARNRRIVILVSP